MQMVTHRFRAGRVEIREMKQDCALGAILARGERAHETPARFGHTDTGDQTQRPIGPH